MEQIFDIAAATIGLEHAMKRLEVLRGVSADIKPVAIAEKKPEKKDESNEEKKRIPRMSPKLATEFKKEINEAGTEIDVDDKKTFDKVKKEFAAYVDGLDEETFAGKNLLEHMKDFAMTKVPTKGSKGAAGGSSAEEEKPVTLNDAIQLSIDDLRKIGMTATLSKAPVGVLWDAVDGRWVTGPSEDEDEDMVEKTLKEKKYAVGTKTGRVYEDKDDRDVFVGFAGVGPYKSLL